MRLWIFALCFGFSVVTVSASSIGTEYEAVLNGWKDRKPEDAADRWIRSLKSGNVAISPSDFTAKTVRLLEKNEEPARSLALIQLVELKGGRHPSAQAPLERLLQSPLAKPQRQAVLNAILLTSTDAHFLSLALIEIRELLPTAADYDRVMKNKARWQTVPSLLRGCVTGGVLPPNDALDVITNSDDPIIDDLERRNHCLSALGLFPDVETVGFLKSFVEKQPKHFGTDSFRVLKVILRQALLVSDWPVIEAANKLALQVVEGGRYKKGELGALLRINALIALALPGNLSIEDKLEKILRQETDRDVARFLKQCRVMIRSKPESEG